MKAILKREIKNFLKNPIFWAGLLIMVAGIYQILQPYLELHYFTSNAEIQNMSVSSLEDADVMEGYIPVSDEERTENGYEEIYRTMTEDMGLPTEEANEAISSIRGMNTEEACDYLEKEYRYYGAQYSLEGSKYKQGDANEVNTYIQKKMQEHPYSYYFARKYADFAGLFMAFFATILLAFLFLRDTRKDTYELLHTKPIAPWQYVLGKVGSGFLILMMALAVLTLVFGGLCLGKGLSQGFSVNLLDFLVADIVYIMPNMLMIVCVYAIAALIFKNPLPATPLLFLYIIYSNMGGTGADGRYGYQGRLLSIIVRFPGRFFDTEMPPMLVLNQTFLILASIVIVCIGIVIWNRRRVY